MNRTHPPQYPWRLVSENKTDWLDVAGRVCMAAGVLCLAVVLVALW